MKIVVNNKFYIKNERWSYELFQVVNGKNKDGSDKADKFIGSYNTLKTALYELAKYDIYSDGEDMPLSEYVDRLDYSYNELIKSVKDVK